MMLAFLQDDIAAWLAQYESKVPKAERRGSAEDRLMLKGLIARDQGLDSLEPARCQAWHNALSKENRTWNWQLLELDGDLGEVTRAQLIGDYMNLDHARLPTNIYPVVHGCGSAFPAPEPEPGSAAERFSEQRHRHQGPNPPAGTTHQYFLELRALGSPLEETSLPNDYAALCALLESKSVGTSGFAASFTAPAMS